MKNEIDAATLWWVSQVTARPDQSHTFKQSLCSALYERYNGHWYESEPFRGQGYRCISYLPEENKIDDVLLDSAKKAGLDLTSLLQGLEGGVTMWVDPGDVEVKFISSRRHKILYKNSALTPTKDVRTRPRTRSFQKYSPGPSSIKPNYHRMVNNAPVRKLNFATPDERASRASSPPFNPTLVMGDSPPFRASSPPYVPNNTHLDNDLRMVYGQVPHQSYPMSYGKQFAPSFGSWQPNAAQCGMKESDYFFQEQHLAMA